MKIVIQDEPKLYEASGQESFLSIPPYAVNADVLAREQLWGREYPRKALSDLLTTYNEEIGNDQAALQNCMRLSQNDSVCIVTGQQVGLMCGPMYTILKAISCVQMAREMDAVPIFWAASEDHDVGEIDHTYLLDSLGNLQKHHLALPKDGRFVESIVITSEHLHVMNGFREALGLVPVSEAWIGKSFVECMLSLMAELFRGTGLVFLEPYLLRPLAKTFFHREIEESERIQEILVETSGQLKKAPLAVGKGTNLFLKVAGKYRRKITRTEGGFEVGHELYSSKEMREMIEQEPHRFSTNAAARPVLQSLLIPTLAYVGGPTEILYHHQLKHYFDFHGAAMPWVVPRLSVTLIPPFARDLLDQCGLKPWEEIPQNWEEVIDDIASGVDELEAKWRESAEEVFGSDLSSEAIQTYSRHTVRGLERKVIHTRLKKIGIPSHGLHLLQNLIQPHGQLQERVLNWFGFQGEASEDLVQTLLEKTDWKTKGHLYCFYE